MFIIADFVETGGN